MALKKKATKATPEPTPEPAAHDELEDLFGAAMAGLNMGINLATRKFSPTSPEVAMITTGRDALIQLQKAVLK